jgi:hypothetical protein
VFESQEGRVIDPSHEDHWIYTRIRISGFRRLKLRSIATEVAKSRYVIFRRVRKQCGATGVGDVDRWHTLSGSRSEKS